MSSAVRAVRSASRPPRSIPPALRRRHVTAGIPVVELNQREHHVLVVAADLNSFVQVTSV